jgi:hypothetical protein
MICLILFDYLFLHAVASEIFLGQVPRQPCIGTTNRPHHKSLRRFEICGDVQPVERVTDASWFSDKIVDIQKLSENRCDHLSVFTHSKIL